MNIEARKQKLIHWIDGLHDDKTVKRLEILQHVSDEWQAPLTATELNMIDAGVAAIEAGEVHDHHVVMEEAITYLRKKK